MKYEVGMYGGSFDPLHIGHLNNIIQAASLCNRLFIVLSWSANRDSVPKEIRYRWLLNSCKHLPNVEIVLVEDEAISKDSYCWDAGATKIKELIGLPDAVFCGDDYKDTGTFERLYDTAEAIYFDRSIVPISSTEIRSNPYKFWDFIPQICRGYYTAKVLIMGGESTGKSTLVKNLSIAYNTNCVEEAGRNTCEYAGGEEFMNRDDMIENYLRQRLDVDEAVKHSNKLLFVDTDALTTLFYSTFLLSGNKGAMAQCVDLGVAIHKINDWDLVLFLEPDVEFIQDGTRNETIKADRIKYSEQLKELLNIYGVKYQCISGDYSMRFNKAKEAVFEKLKIL